MVQMIIEANESFDELIQKRHDDGAEKYGPFKFLGANTLEEAMQEVLDLANYARYTYIKLWMLNAQIAEEYGQPDPEDAKQFYSTTPDIQPAKPRFVGETQ
jgi:hypothetical protein